MWENIKITDWIMAISSAISVITIVKLFLRDKQKDEELKHLKTIAEQSINHLNEYKSV